MTIENKEYLRTILSKLDGMSNEVNEILEDEYIQDDEEQMTAQIYDAISDLQLAITEYQEFNKYI
jgi:hypothetical protein|tara:strand:- start:11 stop:205 length:195 start_codon:yes stop_codon:yes gene_type:complete